MQAWRLCRARYADFSGEGARIAGGRWNSPGRSAVYLADHPALSVLEVRVHLDLPLDMLPADYVLLRIDLDGLAIEEIEAEPAAPRRAGDAWLDARTALLLRLPSALVPRCHNFLLNPRHQEAASITATDVIPYRFDGRLWS